MTWIFCKRDYPTQAHSHQSKAVFVIGGIGHQTSPRSHA
jgi:hypothetical protein